MKTNYQVGRTFEYRVMRDLGRRGFWTMRSAGSHGIVDIHAVSLSGNLATLYVQCKTDGRISPDDRLTLSNISALAGGIPVLASTVGRKLEYQLLLENGGRKAVDPEDFGHIGSAEATTEQDDKDEDEATDG